MEETLLIDDWPSQGQEGLPLDSLVNDSKLVSIYI